MPLTLKIISKQRHILGADSIRVFSVHGGSIGRAPDNDWVLPDPDRYISGHHAAIDYRGGAYYLRDNSTNGVFVNHSDEPVGRGTPIRLYDGDELRMGDYLFEVNIVNISRDGADDSGEAPADEPPGRRLRRRAPAAPLSLKLLGEEADELQEAAQEEADLESEFIKTVRMADEELERQLREGALQRAVTSETSGIELSPEEAVPVLPELNLKAKEPKVFGTTDGRDFAAAVRLLMECAGLDAGRLPHGSEQQAIVTAGRLIRATAEGLQQALQARTLVKARLQLDMTGMQSAGNNPLKFIPTTQEALEQLFYGEAEGYLGPVEAVEDALVDLRTHQAAMVKAMQVALRELLDRLDPDTLEDKFQGKVKRGGLLSRSSKPQYWELYRETYEQMSAHSDEILFKLVGARFAQTYAAELQQLNRRKPARSGKAK
jgi:type VI secretion system protein